jgi:hypothetical protein
LVVAGLVPPQKPSLDRYHRRIDEMIASVPEQARLVVRRYVRWAVTRPLQQKVDTGATVTPQLVDWPLERARVACQFTSAVAAGGARLGTISQSQLDAWVAELPSHRPALRAFVRWAVGHDYMPAGLDVSAASSREPRAAMDDCRCPERRTGRRRPEQRWASMWPCAMTDPGCTCSVAVVAGEGYPARPLV